MLILRQQNAEVKPRAPVEEPGLKDVHVEPAHNRARRHPRPDAMLHPAPPLNGSFPESKLDGALIETLLNPINLLRLQGAVLIVLGDEVLQPAPIVMFHLPPLQIPRAAVDDHVLVNLPLLIPRLAMPKKTHVPAWVIAAVFDLLSQENQITIDVKTILRAIVRRG